MNVYTYRPPELDYWIIQVIVVGSFLELETVVFSLLLAGFTCSQLINPLAMGMTDYLTYCECSGNFSYQERGCKSQFIKSMKKIHIFCMTLSGVIV